MEKISREEVVKIVEQLMLLHDEEVLKPTLDLIFYSLPRSTSIVEPRVESEHLSYQQDVKGQ